LLLRGKNQSYDAMPADPQPQHFTALSELLQEKIGTKLNDLICKTFHLKVSNKKQFSENDSNADDSYNVAALLLSDENNYPGIDMAYFPNGIDTISGRQQLENESVLKQLEEAVGVYKLHYQFEMIQGMYRTTIELVPETAFREAILNAVVHRDWMVPTRIRVSMFPDYMEIVSPGGLPYGMTEADYFKDYLSISRNPILANVFFRTGLMETFGTGVKRIQKAYQNAKEKPQFDIGDRYIRVVLPVLKERKQKKKENNAPAELDQLLDFIRKHESVARRDVVMHFSWSSSKAYLKLTELCNDGKIKKVGNGRSVRYRLIV